MSKHNLFNKKVKKQILTINDLIESFFNNIRYFSRNSKKVILSKHNRVFLFSVLVIFLILSYFLIPTFYNKDLINTEIKNQIFKKYNISVKFNEKIKYGLLPKPHFVAKNISLLRDQKEIGIAETFKIFISMDQLLRFNSINVKSLVFKKTDFNINKKDLVFFEKLLKTEPNENKIIIKNSNIFFEDNNGEVLFINKIYDSEFYYDSKNLQNILKSKNEIFKVPYKFIIKYDRFNKKVFTDFFSKKIRLTIKNIIEYDQDYKKGFADILLINKSTSLKYELKKDSMSFISEDNTNSYNGEIFLKPFYFFANFNYDGISSKNLFKETSILFDLIKSELLNNDNLNINLNFNIKDIININELNNLKLKVGVENGNISFTNSSIYWKDDLEIQFKESLLNYDKEKINLIGRIIVNIINKDDFYSSYQVKKDFRKDIKKIEFDFFYNLEKKNISFDNVRIDSLSSSKIDEYINKFNSQKNTNLNKITLKNFISNFFKIYSG